MVSSVFKTIKSRVPCRISDLSLAMRTPVVCPQEYRQGPVGCQQGSVSSKCSRALLQELEAGQRECERFLPLIQRRFSLPKGGTALLAPSQNSRGLPDPLSDPCGR